MALTPSGESVLQDRQATQSPILVNTDDGLGARVGLMIPVGSGYHTGISFAGKLEGVIGIGGLAGVRGISRDGGFGVYGEANKYGFAGYFEGRGRVTEDFTARSLRTDAIYGDTKSLGGGLRRAFFALRPVYRYESDGSLVVGFASGDTPEEFVGEPARDGFAGSVRIESVIAATVDEVQTNSARLDELLAETRDTRADAASEFAVMRRELDELRAEVKDLRAGLKREHSLTILPRP